ncbi:MAG: hypothetical protein QG641_2385 [Candidatus Poribacteria bacterium]|nr:hypothetical protein [Candidatus Poribacteria bacterium]
MTCKTLIIIIFSAIVCLFIISGISYAKLEDGLISAWTFDDGTANDFQGSNKGNIIGGVKAIDGKSGKALNFNGTDGYIQIPHNETMNVIANGFTISAWIKSNAGTNGNSGVVTKGKGTGWGIPYSFKITLDWWGVCSASAEGYFNGSGALNNPGIWVLACLTADGKQAIGYSAIDGGEVEIKPSGEGNPKVIAGPYLIEADSPMEIGVARKADGTTDRFFGGIIDEVYFWGRAISADEVAELAKGAKPGVVTSVKPAGKLSTLWGTIKQQ